MTIRSPRGSDSRVFRAVVPVLRVVGVVWAAFWASAGVPLVFDWPREGSAVGSALHTYIMWGHGGESYLVMLMGINISFGVLLIYATRDLSRYGRFVDAFLVVQTSHLLFMVADSLRPVNTVHWMGDLPPFVLALVLIAVFWIPARSDYLGRSLAAASGERAGPRP